VDSGAKQWSNGNIIDEMAMYNAYEAEHRKKARQFD